MSASREKRSRQSGGFLEETAPKKPEPKKNDFIYTVIAILLAVVLVGSAGLMVWQLGIAPNLPVATIGGESIHAHEANFYYINSYLRLANQMASYGTDLSTLGLDSEIPLKQQSPPQTGDAETDYNGTWHDYFCEQALYSARQVRAFVKLAKDEGMTINEDGKTHVAEELEALREYVDTETELSIKDYLVNYYGPRMSEAEYERIVSDGYLAQQYASAKGESFTFTTDQLAAFYDEHSKDYDVVTFRAYYVAANAETNDEMTDEEKTAANEAAAADALVKAQTMADTAGTEDEFIDLIAATYADADSDEDGEADEEQAATLAEFNRSSADSASLVSGHNYSYINQNINSDIAEWLFEDGRAANDTFAVGTTGGAYAVMFRERIKEDYNTVNVRHILVAFEMEEDADEPTEEQKEAAKVRADELLALFDAGDKTEDSFAALATEHTDDPGSAESGGLYERVAQGEMTQNFDVWIFGSARQPGDVDIVETSYGYHVMYFVGKDLPRWEAQAEDGAKNEAFEEWQTEILEGTEIVQKSGMSSVGLPNQR